MLPISVHAFKEAGKKTGLAFLVSLWYCLATTIFFGSCRFAVVMVRFCIGTVLHPWAAITRSPSTRSDPRVLGQDWGTLDDDDEKPAPQPAGDDRQHNDLLLRGGAALYEGLVGHVRRAPARHSFWYPVRYALVNVDRPPGWWRASVGEGKGEERATAGQGIDGKPHLSGDEARAIAGTDGPVLLLTIPTSLGYEQNPISIYYCYRTTPATKSAPASPPAKTAGKPPVWPTAPWTPAMASQQPSSQRPRSPAPTTAAEGSSNSDKDTNKRNKNGAGEPSVLPPPVNGGSSNNRSNNAGAVMPSVGASPPALVCCIAEVTNTPWGERVVFAFAPEEDRLPKPLHVSPFQDMDSCWHMQALPPGAQLKVTITCEHPEHGDYFVARLQAGRVPVASMPPAHALPDPWFLGMPHRVACWIYWHALLLWWKGVRFLSHPKYTDGDAYRARVLDKEAAMKRERGTCVAGTVPILASGAMACPAMSKDSPNAKANGGGGGGMACPVLGAKGGLAVVGVSTKQACGGAGGLGPLPPIHYRDARAYPWL